jgi:hypothetical protein
MKKQKRAGVFAFKSYHKSGQKGRALDGCWVPMVS